MIGWTPQTFPSKLVFLFYHPGNSIFDTNSYSYHDFKKTHPFSVLRFSGSITTNLNYVLVEGTNPEFTSSFPKAHSHPVYFLLKPYYFHILFIQDLRHEYNPSLFYSWHATQILLENYFFSYYYFFKDRFFLALTENTKYSGINQKYFFYFFYFPFF